MTKLFLIALISLFCIQTFAAVQGPLYNLVDNRYLGLIDRLKQVQYSDQKASLIRNAANTYGFNCTQAWGLIESFKSDGDKLIGLEIIKNNIVDPANKVKQIIEMFNRTDDREKATNILVNITAAKTVANPNDVTAVWNLPFTNKMATETLVDLIKVINQVPGSVGKIKVAEVAIMSRTEVLIPEQVMMLFGAYDNYRDILTLKELIDERIVGISCEQMVTLLRRFSFENQRSSILNSMQCGSNIASSWSSDLVALADFIQGSLRGQTCEELSPIAERFSFENHLLDILEGFSKSIIDIENKLTILDAFNFGSNKEKAKKIIDNFKPNSYIFGSPSGKVVFVLDVSGSMSASFKVSPTQSLTRLDFMRREFGRVVNGFNESIAFNVMVFADNIVQWNTNTLVNATKTNIANAVAFANRYNANGGTNSYEALRIAFNTPGVETIYFLSDGAPQSGLKTDPSAIVADVRTWNAKGKIKINSIALLMGTYGSENKQQSRNFMKMLSDVTGGNFRALESDS